MPCIDQKAAVAEVQRIAKRLKLELVIKVVIEDGVKGLRIWRV